MVHEQQVGKAPGKLVNAVLKPFGTHGIVAQALELFQDRLPQLGLGFHHQDPGGATLFPLPVSLLSLHALALRQQALDEQVAADPRPQLHEVGGLVQEIIGTAGEALLLGLTLEGREVDHGDIIGFQIALDASANLEAVHARHHNI